MGSQQQTKNSNALDHIGIHSLSAGLQSNEKLILPDWDK